MQVYVNGHDVLARKLDRLGVKYQFTTNVHVDRRYAGSAAMCGSVREVGLAETAGRVGSAIQSTISTRIETVGILLGGGARDGCDVSRQVGVGETVSPHGGTRTDCLLYTSDAADE